MSELFLNYDTAISLSKSDIWLRLSTVHWVDKWTSCSMQLTVNLMTDCLQEENKKDSYQHRCITQLLKKDSSIAALKIRTSSVFTIS